MCEYLPAQTLAVTFEPAAAGLARRFLREQICPVHGFDRLEEAQLVVSELVTNGIQHGAPPIWLSVECRGTEGIWLSVTDASPAAVVSAFGVDSQTDLGADVEAESGRGVRIVDYISRAWGVVEHTDGKEVWALV